MARQRILGVAAALLALLALLPACSRKRTEVVIGVATDLSAPDLLDEVKLEIWREGVKIFDIPPWPVPGMSGERYELPGSFGVYSDDGSEPRIEVRVQGLKQGVVIVERRSILALVAEQTLFLRMALVQRCLQMSDCPNSSDTCVEGHCRPAEIDGHTLPLYDEAGRSERYLTCSSGTAFRDTKTGALMPLVGPGCGSDEFCEEGTCYKIAAMGGGPDAGTTGAWSQAPLGAAQSPSARQFSGASQAVYDPGGQRVLLWGGTAGGFATADTWAYDGSWHPLGTGIGPADTDAVGPSAFDRARGVLVTYREPSGDLVELDAASATWTRRARGSDPGAPPARQFSRLGYDVAHGRTVLFGGAPAGAPSGVLGDTWLWNGTTWQAATPASAPPPRRDGALAWDEPLGRLVLFGGRADAELSDTWAWDGTSWSPLATSFPNPVVSYDSGLLGFDPVKKRLLWLNGLREVYGFDGTGWSLLLVDPNAPPLGSFSGALDEGRALGVAFGGTRGTATPSQDTWLLDLGSLP